MIHWTVLKALIVGVSILIFAQVINVGVLIKISHHELLRSLLFATPFISSFATAYFAPYKKIIAGFSMSIFGAGIGVLSAFIYEYFGLHVDRIGGILATFVILFVYYGVLSVIGSYAGSLLGRRVGKAGRS